MKAYTNLIKSHKDQNHTESAQSLGKKDANQFPLRSLTSCKSHYRSLAIGREDAGGSTRISLRTQTTSLYLYNRLFNSS